MLSKPGIEWIERARAHLSFWRSARNKSLGALTIALTFVLLSNASQEAHAAPASAHTCAANVGFGGLASGTLALTKAGDGCAVIKYTSGGTTYFETFNYTGKTIGQLITLDSTTATKDGYTFGGWNIGGTTYPVGASFTISTVDVAPAAVWNAATYLVTYNGNGATGGTTPNGGTFTTGGSYSAASNTGSLVLLEPNHSAMLGKR